MKPIVIGSFDEKDYLKAIRRASRLREISEYGKESMGRPVKHSLKKAYSRKSKYPMQYDF